MTDRKPILYIFSGLPGVGKSTLARRLATYISATYLRIDTIEQGLRDLCQIKVEGEGYRMAYRVATDNLKLGKDVVTDCCNTIRLTRDEWEQVAIAAEADFVNLEIVCSDEHEHKRRVELRRSEVSNLRLPNWQQVKNREYHPWHKAVVQIDTAGKSVDEAFTEMVLKLKK